jgi:hypothetical protein
LWVFSELEEAIVTLEEVAFINSSRMHSRGEHHLEDIIPTY